MKCARFAGSGRVEVVEVDRPGLDSGEVLVAIRSSGLCGSELKRYRGEEPMDHNPGHEQAGVVVERRRTSKLTVGDRVGVHAVWGCGACNWCRQGRYTWCDQHGSVPWGHADFVAAPEHVLLPLPDDIDDDVGVLLSGDGLGVPYHAGKRLPVRGGDTVLVVGCGPIGLGHVLVQSFRGARVIAADLSATRLQLARELGAQITVQPPDGDAAAAVREATSGRMADAAIECVGRPETVQLCLRCVGKGGYVMCSGEQGDVSVNISRDLIRSDVTLMGSWFFHFCEFFEMVDLVRRGLPVHKLVTHHFPLAQADEAFRLFAAGETGKVMLHPQSSV